MDIPGDGDDDDERGFDVTSRMVWSGIYIYIGT